MSASMLSTSEACQRFEHVMAELAERIQRKVPGVCYRSHHGANDCFVWCVVARFRKIRSEARPGGAALYREGFTGQP